MKGQSLIEYLTLLVIVIGLIQWFGSHSLIKSFYEEGGVFEQAFQSKFQRAYRHALPVKKEETQNPSESLVEHQSYYFGGSTRFFGPNARYP